MNLSHAGADPTEGERMSDESELDQLLEFFDWLCEERKRQRLSHSVLESGLPNAKVELLTLRAQLAAAEALDPQISETAHRWQERISAAETTAREATARAERAEAAHPAGEERL